MRNWQADAPKEIAAIHAAMPGCTPDELRKALRKHCAAFSYGTSWGKKVWAKHCRVYMGKLTAGPANVRVTEWPSDISFPFRSAP